MIYSGPLQVNWNHPLAAGLQAIALPTGVITPYRNLPYGGRTTDPAGISTGSVNNITIPSGSSISLIVVANLSAVTADAIAIGRARFNGSTNFGSELRFNGSTLELDIGNGSASWFFGYKLTTVTTGRAAYGGAFAAGGTASSIALYKDGIQQTLTGDSTGSPSIVPFDSTFDVGKNTASGATAVTGALGGSIEVGLYYSTALSATDMAAVQLAALQRNLPFLVRKRTWITFSGAAVPDNLLGQACL